MVDGGMLLVIFVLSLALLFLFILKFNMNPFLALIITGALTGLAVGMPLDEIADTIADGFGDTLAGVGIVIALGVMLGELLASSGAVERIAQTMLKVAGKKKSPLAMSLTGTAVSIPVYFDAAFVILINIVKNLHKKTKIPIITFVTALAVGLIVTHSMIPPTPGPLVVADNTGASIGLFIIYGIIAALPAVVVGGYWYGKLIGKSKRFAGLDELTTANENEATTEAAAGGTKIGAGLSFFLLLLPIVLILLNTIFNLVTPDTTISQIFAFIGDKNIALLISVIIAALLLRPYIQEKRSKLFSKAVDSSGMILLITGAGGGFGSVITETGMGDYLVDTMTSWSIPILLLAFILSQVLRASLGSATVALVTTSSILGPMAVDLGVSPVLLGLAISAGGIGLSLPNDSGFWVVNRFAKLTIPQTIVAWSLGGFIAGVSALIMVYILSMFSGILPGI